MEAWNSSESNQKIGDIFKYFAPFLKMYTEYIQNFDKAMSTINQTYEKNAKFKQIMDEIHVSRKSHVFMSRHFKHFVICVNISFFIHICITNRRYRNAEAYC